MLEQENYYQSEEGTYAPVWVLFKRELHNQRMSVNTFCRIYGYNYNYLRSKLTVKVMEKKVVDEYFNNAGLEVEQEIIIPEFKWKKISER